MKTTLKRGGRWNSKIGEEIVAWMIWGVYSGPIRFRTNFNEKVRQTKGATCNPDRVVRIAFARARTLADVAELLGVTSKRPGAKPVWGEREALPHASRTMKSARVGPEDAAR